MPTRSIQQLLADARRGHAAAAESFYKEHAPAMLAYARALLHNHAAAEDAVQQAFVNALTLDHRELAAVRDIQAWLIRVTRNAALNAERTLTRSAAREKAYDNHMAHTRAVETPDHSGLLAAVDTLPEQDREVILLKHVAGLTFDQIAWALDENRNTLATRYRAALARLRTTLTREEGVRRG